MSTQQINIRIDVDLAAALDRVAREESLDRATAIRKLLEQSVKTWEVEHAVLGVMRGDLSIGRAAEESGLSAWELLDATRVAGVAHPLTAAEARRRLDLLSGTTRDTLPDRPPTEGGVLLVGINPAPVSVAAGHYYQGRLGRRLWRRLERLGLLRDPEPGMEDEAFVAAGNGLTDLVNLPTASADLLSTAELRAGRDALRDKIKRWQPRLVLFAFKAPATELLGDVAPGLCGEIEGVPAFLLSSPYAASAETARIDGELQTFLGAANAQPTDSEPTQRVTGADLRAGQIRLPRGAKRFFPTTKTKLEVVLRGTRVEATYDPRLGPDRERSGVLRVGRRKLGELVVENEVLMIARGLGGVPRLD
ncbi:MAG: uracil-DNA glycosylase family protein [Gaiella sp.]